MFPRTIHMQLMFDGSLMEIEANVKTFFQNAQTVSDLSQLLNAKRLY